MAISKLQVSLEAETQPKTVLDVLSSTKGLVNMSRSAMSAYYTQWDDAMNVYKGELSPDREDRKANERKEPVKMIVPIAFSQVETFVSFAVAMLTAKDNIFELNGVNPEAQKAAQSAMALLSRDLAKSKLEVRLGQFFRDMARFRIGVLKESWVEEKEYLAAPPVAGPDGIEVNVAGYTETISYQGNEIVNVSPYLWFPDTRLQLHRFQEGEFCASEEVMSIAVLKGLEAQGVVHGIKYVQPMSKNVYDKRGVTRLQYEPVDVSAGRTSMQSTKSNGTCIVTECQRVLVPKEYLLDDGTPLGPEEYPVKYLIWYANDDRIIRMEPLGYNHNRFTYSMAQFTEDQESFMGVGLSDVIDKLQHTISWLINSRVNNVRKTLHNRFLVDPEQVELADLIERKEVIRTKPGWNKALGLDKAVKSLEMQDVTSGHINDANALHGLIQITTGISDNALGQFNSGRRSATEARNVNSGTFNRLKMIVQSAYRSALEPMGRRMLSNYKQGLTVPQLVQLLGQKQVEEAMLEIQSSDLNGKYDFLFWDGTTPSERYQIGQLLSDVVVQLLGNPQAALALQIDPKAVFHEALQMRGVRHPDRFDLPPLPIQQENVQPGEGAGVPPDGTQGTASGIDAAGVESGVSVPDFSALFAGSGGAQ